MKIKNLDKYIELYDTNKYLFDVIGPAARSRGYLTFDEFHKIAMWKSVRQKQRYIKNKGRIEKISKEAFAEKDDLRSVQVLYQQLEGVGIPTASALLSVVFPEKYPVIDKRCLKILRSKGQDIGESMSDKTWLKYLDIMRGWAQANEKTPRELDMAFFAMDVEESDKDNRNLYP